jgi:hypothetical protein
MSNGCQCPPSLQKLPGCRRPASPLWAPEVDIRPERQFDSCNEHRIRHQARGGRALAARFPVHERGSVDAIIES